MMFTRSYLVLLSTVAVALAQHHGSDPFHGSNCTCDTFCDYTCAINATAPANMTLYRMTPDHMFDMHNKNTGDSFGDTSFVLSRRTSALECRQNPDSFMCKGVTQFDGDDSNNTDVVIQFTIEVDGQWGPYLYCNPKNISEPLGPWDCDVTLSGGGGPTPDPFPPAQCKAGNFSVFDDFCWKGFSKTVAAADKGACCAAASASKTSKWTFTADGKCELFEFAYQAEPCTGGSLGEVSAGSSQCNCSRVHKTVGKENLDSLSYGGSSMHPAGGEWYSHPEQGQCMNGARPGDGSGCTWRVVEQVAMIEAKCMYGLLDDNVVQHNPSCFSGCAQPTNKTSTCYLECYTKATEDMTPTQLVAPWEKGFSVCPPVAPGKRVD